MVQIQTLEENKEISKWQKEFKQFLKGKEWEGGEIKARFEKKFKMPLKGGKGYTEYGPNSHNLIISAWGEKVETRFTYHHPFLTCDLTKVEAMEGIAEELLDYALRYWTGVAIRTNCKMVVWEDYKRGRGNVVTEPPKEIESILNAYGFTRAKEDYTKDWLLQTRYSVLRYVLNLEDNYVDFAYGIIHEVKKHIASEFEKYPTSYLNKNSSRNKSDAHSVLSFYHNGYHADVEMTFLDSGVSIKENELEFERVITSADEVEAVIQKLFEVIFDHNKLKNLIKPPRERFDILMSNLYFYSMRNATPDSELEQIYSFLLTEYEPEVIENWAATAPSENKFSYIRENDVILFNFLDYLFVTKDKWVGIYQVEDKEESYKMFKEKYLEQYYPRVERSIQEFKQKSGLV